MHGKEIEKLREMIKNQNIDILSQNTPMFEGADIIITEKPDCSPICGLSVYTVVFTPFAKQLSWLIFQLKEIFSNEINYMNKYYFYPALAQSAKDYIDNGKNDCQGLLFAVLDRSETIQL